MLPCFIEIPVFNASCIDPDQTPRSAASDLGLQCLRMSLLWGARHKWAYAWEFMPGTVSGDKGEVGFLIVCYLFLCFVIVALSVDFHLYFRIFIAFVYECVKLAWEHRSSLLYYYGINRIPNHTSNSKPTSYTFSSPGRVQEEPLHYPRHRRWCRRPNLR